MTEPPRPSIERCRIAAKASLSAVLRFLAPPRCPACGRETGPAATLLDATPGVCHACRTALAPPERNRCLRCAAPSGPFIDTARGCVCCRSERFQFERVVRLGIYEAQLRDVCLAVKRPGSRELAAALAALFWEREGKALADARADVVIPVPHHWSETLWSGPRVPETLGMVLARRLRVDFAPPILAKVRRTPKQSGLPPSRRRTNLAGAFRVPRRFVRDVEGRRVLLVDDILTTGATADEASRALRKAGAASVVAAVIARGLGRRSLMVRTG